MKKLAICLAIIACLFIGVAHAEQPALMQGGWELSVDGFFDFEDFDGTSLAADVALGYFFWDNILLGGAVEVVFAEGDPDDTTIIGVQAFGEYNFDLDSNWVPFVGASIGYANIDIGDFDDNAFTVAGAVGVKYFMTENWAISGQLIFTWASEDIFVNDGTVEDTDIGATVGIRTYF